MKLRAQSLTVSHRARCRAIEEQVEHATNDKIRVMKASELTRANSDYQTRMNELDRAGESADIHTEPVVFGTITVLRPRA